MGVDEKLLGEIVTRILAVADARRIILFGSAATGTMTKDSDIDLLVLEDAPEDIRAEMIRIRRALYEIDFPIDVMVMATDRFEETKSLVGGLARPAHKQGRVLYDAA
jgi:predicted nucleotidyltransferase